MLPPPSLLLLSSPIRPEFHHSLSAIPLRHHHHHTPSSSSSSSSSSSPSSFHSYNNNNINIINNSVPITSFLLAKREHLGPLGFFQQKILANNQPPLHPPPPPPSYIPSTPYAGETHDHEQVADSPPPLSLTPPLDMSVDAAHHQHQAFSAPPQQSHFSHDPASVAGGGWMQSRTHRGGSLATVSFGSAGSAFSTGVLPIGMGYDRRVSDPNPPVHQQQGSFGGTYSEGQGTGTAYTHTTSNPSSSSSHLRQPSSSSTYSQQTTSSSTSTSSSIQPPIVPALPTLSYASQSSHPQYQQLHDIPSSPARVLHTRSAHSVQSRGSFGSAEEVGSTPSATALATPPPLHPQQQHIPYQFPRLPSSSSSSSSTGIRYTQDPQHAYTHPPAPPFQSSDDHHDNDGEGLSPISPSEDTSGRQNPNLNPNRSEDDRTGFIPDMTGSIFGSSAPPTTTTGITEVDDEEATSLTLSLPPPSAATSPSKQYSFISLPHPHVRKRPRRRYDEIERLYQCCWPGCTKSYGTLNHLNAHVTMQKHGSKRTPQEFKEMRKNWRRSKQRDVEERSVAAPAASGASSPAIPLSLPGYGSDVPRPRSLTLTIPGSQPPLQQPYAPTHGATRLALGVPPSPHSSTSLRPRYLPSEGYASTQGMQQSMQGSGMGEAYPPWMGGFGHPSSSHVHGGVMGQQQQQQHGSHMIHHSHSHSHGSAERFQDYDAEISPLDNQQRPGSSGMEEFGSSTSPCVSPVQWRPGPGANEPSPSMHFRRGQSASVSPIDERDRFPPLQLTLQPRPSTTLSQSHYLGEYGVTLPPTATGPPSHNSPLLHHHHHHHAHPTHHSRSLSQPSSSSSSYPFLSPPHHAGLSFSQSPVVQPPASNGHGRLPPGSTLLTPLNMPPGDAPSEEERYGRR